MRSHDGWRHAGFYLVTGEADETNRLRTGWDSRFRTEGARTRPLARSPVGAWTCSLKPPCRVHSEVYSNILVPTDGARRMAKVVEHALDIAEQYQARVHVLHVVDTEWAELLYDESIRERLFERGEEMVDEVAEQVDYIGLEVTTEVREGVPHEVILEYVRENDIDLVVMGIDKPTALGEYAVETIAENLLGGTTDRIVRRAPIPVMTVRA